MSVVWENFVSAHGSATALNRESFGILFCFLLFILILCIPVCDKHKHLLFGSTVCQIGKQIRPKTGKTIFLSIFFILILCISFHKMYKQFVSGSTLCHIMEQLRP